MIQANGRDKNNPPGKIIKRKAYRFVFTYDRYECFELQEKALETRLGIPIILELMPSTYLLA